MIRNGIQSPVGLGHQEQTGRLDRAVSTNETNVELSKVELQILAARITSLVDTLWKVRNLSVTLLLAVLAGTMSIATPQNNAPQNSELAVPLLIMAILVPVSFMIGDVRNNRWCRRLLEREQTIHKYLADGARDRSFIPFEPRSKSESQNDAVYQRETSHFRSIADPNALSIYGA